MIGNETAVAVLAKAPVPGKVKTRFCPPCTPEQAAAFARAFLEDTGALLQHPTVAKRIRPYLSFLGDYGLLADILPGEPLEQRGADLSERIANATDDLFRLGHKRVLVLAADCPTVDPVYLEGALDALLVNDVVFGPARDGGCVLVGLNGPNRTVFSDVTMSTNHVFSDMQSITDNLSLESITFPQRYDLDNYSDLRLAISSGELDHARATLRCFSDTKVQP